ncbi:hypothetical protein [Paraburkholderia sp. MM5477-R1]|uniref:hypothetical protein n=1 Tax=Paraburkholderia sp. MM5477-R1 TaxID=2991062 RepID=UPI003D1E20A5
MNSEKKEESFQYTNDHWENDPFLTQNPERAARVERNLYPTMKALGLSPDQIKDPEQKAAYAEFLQHDAIHGKAEDAPPDAG